MTLNVSLRVPDGIVIASDSLSTLLQSINQKVNVSATCKKCSEPMEIKDVETPPISVPSSSWPYTQKLFPVAGQFGLSFWGSGFINSRSVYNHMIELGPKVEKLDRNFTVIGDALSKYFHEQLQAEWKKLGIAPELQPDDNFPFGFQFVGYLRESNGEIVPVTRAFAVGKKIQTQEWKGIGIVWSGDSSVVIKLFPGGKTEANFAAFSLQDAIDYAKFLIRTTADYQRFSGRLPTVGGDIDIALVTHHRGFQWIAQKQLYRILDQKVEVTL